MRYKITIEISDKVETKNQLKNLIDREDFNSRLKTAVDNGKGLMVENHLGELIYIIHVEQNKSRRERK